MNSMTIKIPGDLCPVDKYKYLELVPGSLVLPDGTYPTQECADVLVEITEERRQNFSTVVCYLSPNILSQASDRAQLSAPKRIKDLDQKKLTQIIKWALEDYEDSLKRMVEPAKPLTFRSFADLVQSGVIYG